MTITSRATTTQRARRPPAFLFNLERDVSPTSRLVPLRTTPRQSPMVPSLGASGRCRFGRSGGGKARPPAGRDGGRRTLGRARHLVDCLDPAVAASARQAELLLRREVTRGWPPSRAAASLTAAAAVPALRSSATGDDLRRFHWHRRRPRSPLPYPSRPPADRGRPALSRRPVDPGLPAAPAASAR
jgi:hypothetical protein